MITKRITLFAIVMAAFVLFEGCKKEEAITTSTPSKTSAFQQSNVYIQRYALCVAELLENDEVRAVIKEEALKKFDGDYDILASVLQEKELSNGLTIGELLLDKLDKFGVGVDYLNNINETIPNLQVSVPVNCENWDVDAFIPAVVPVDVDFDDKANQAIIGYDNMGKPCSFSLKEDPTVPVVVVSVSERIDEKGEERWIEVSVFSDETNELSSSKEIPSNPSSITLTHGAANELILEWPDVNGENGYKVYRKVGQGDFSLRATLGANCNTYVDQALAYGTRYWYKVRSYNGEGTSAYSPFSTTIASGRDDGEELAIKCMKFSTTQDLNQVESWIRGVPELRLRVVKGLQNSSTADCIFTSNIITPPSRSAIVDSWWFNAIEIQDWYVNDFGTVLVFDWEEEDDLYPDTITLNAKYENKATGTIEVGGTITFNVSQHGPIGHKTVFYWDNPYITNLYTINGFNWRLESKRVPV